jgi:CRISPR-associated protein Cmr2
VLAGEAKKAANALLQGYLKEAIMFVAHRNGFLDATRAEKQVDDLLEFYWAAVPLPDPTDYQQQRERLVRLMAARKSTRDFGIPGWAAAGVPKSSLDGQRESVIPKSVYALSRPPSAQNLKDREERMYRCYRARPAEQLSGVDLMKRLAGMGFQDLFYSTSHMAAIPLLERIRCIYDKADPIRQTAMQQCFEDFIGEKVGEKPIWIKDRLETIKSKHPVLKNYDGRILFADRLRDLVGKENEDAARSTLKDLLRCITEEQVIRQGSGHSPNPYYVLIHGDGDRMGEAISKLSSPSRHQEFSAQLAKFAGRARKFIETTGGRTVFAGGDDVLAFLPLHTALRATALLATAFKHLLREFPYQGSATPTLSIGMVVAHHLEPLQDVLGWAKAGESYAKKTLGRGALSITLAKRGGSDRMVGGKWTAFPKRFADLIDLHRLNRVPDGAAYELLQTSKLLAHLPKEALSKEAVRILARKRTQSGEPLDQSLRDRLAHYADNLGLETLANELIVANEFANAMDLAMVALPKTPEVLA